MVSIGFEDNGSWTHKCVGSIVTSNAILTSSKCVKSDDWKILTGTENLKNPTEGLYYDIGTKVPSESYDLAILFTEKHMHFHSKAQPICLYENMGWGKFHGPGKSRSLSQWNGDLTKKIVHDIRIHDDGCTDDTCKIDEEKICPHDSGAPILTESSDKTRFFLTGILSNIDENEDFDCEDRATTFTPVEEATEVWKFIIDLLKGNNQQTLY